MSSKLLPLIRTRDEANDIIDDLELLKKSIYEDGEHSFNSTLNNSVRFWVADIIKDEVKSRDTEEYLDNLIISIKELEDFKITLAFEPSNSGINMFLEYIRNNVNENALLDIVYDKHILGGTIISYKGNYHDFSLSKIFDNEFDEKRDQFLKIIENKLNEPQNATKDLDTIDQRSVKNDT